MRNFEQEVDEVRIRMRCKGFRAVTEEDLKPAAELVMVDVERHFHNGADLPPIGMAGTTKIRLAEEPVKDSNRGDGARIVFYRCTFPQWDGDCFIPLTDFVRDLYVSGDPYGNDTRYFTQTK